jgi:hypothetical protein
MASAAAAASTKRRHPALSIRPSPLTRDRSLSHPHREQVSLARKKFGVEYPTLYAESSHKNAKAFNCVQRAHQQTLEWLAPVMCLTASNGLVFPLAAAASCGVWTVGKLLYIQGYSSGDPKGRHLGRCHRASWGPASHRHGLRRRKQSAQRVGVAAVDT